MFIIIICAAIIVGILALGKHTQNEDAEHASIEKGTKEMIIKNYGVQFNRNATFTYSDGFNSIIEVLPTYNDKLAIIDYRNKMYYVFGKGAIQSFHSEMNGQTISYTSGIDLGPIIKAKTTQQYSGTFDEVIETKDINHPVYRIVINNNDIMGSLPEFISRLEAVLRMYQ